MSKKSDKAPTPDQLAKVLITAAKAGGAVLLNHFNKKRIIREKVDAGLVTQIDVASEKAIIKILKKNFPDFSILTEEEGSHVSQSAGRWIIDPLDGTTNYIHRFPMFCVSLAAEWAGEVLAGVIYHPVLKDVYVGIKGKGAFLNGKKISVSGTEKISDSLLTTGFTYRKDQWLTEEMGAFEDLSKVARAIRRPGSAALDLAYTARGVFDGFWERRLSPWDIAAGALIVQEAGGQVTNFKGDSFKVESTEILASNGKLHGELLDRVSRPLR